MSEQNKAVVGRWRPSLPQRSDLSSRESLRSRPNREGHEFYAFLDKVRDCSEVPGLSRSIPRIHEDRKVHIVGHQVYGRIYSLRRRHAATEFAPAFAINRP